MSKEERFIYHCDNYDYADIIYDTKEYEECDSMQMATNWLNRQDQKIADLEAKLANKDVDILALDTENYSFKQQIDSLRQQLAEKDAEIRVAYSFRKQKCDNLQKALAEKDEQLQQAIEMINNPDTLFYQQQELIDNLTVQLAEKEKEIERKNKTIDGILDSLNDIEDCEFCQRVSTSSGFANCFENCSLCAENYYNEMNFNSKYNQDKISFAIHRIKEIGEAVIDAFNKSFGELYLSDVKEIIDNQIASLKKGVE